MSLAIFILLGSLTVIHSILPLASVEPTVSICHCAFTLLVTVDPLAIVNVTARKLLLTVSVFLAAYEFALVHVAAWVRLFTLAFFEIVDEDAFKHKASYGNLSAASVALPVDPHAVVVRPVGSRQRAEAFALVCILVHLSLVRTAVFVRNQRPKLMIIADVVRTSVSLLLLFFFIWLIRRRHIRHNAWEPFFLRLTCLSACGLVCATVLAA